MSSPAHETYQAELEAALASLEPAIRGEDDLTHASVVAETKGEVSEDMQFTMHRRTLMQNTLAAMAALEEDGYPDLPQEEVSAAVLEELDQQIADLLAARQRFTLEPPAVTVMVDLGEPSEKVNL